MWSKILTFIAKLFGANTTPPEVSGSDLNLQSWWDVYRSKAPWLSYDFVTSDGKKRTRRRKTLNIAKVVTSELAGLVLAEVPQVDAGDLVDAVILKERLWDNLKKSTEYQATLGGQVLKICLEADKVSIDFVKAMNFIPLAWDNATVTEAAFLDKRVKGKKTLVRVETHRRASAAAVEGAEIVEGYKITNRVFDQQTDLEVPLADFDEGLVPEVFVPIEYPLFAYIRNPEANNIDPESPLGIAIFANALDTLEALDVAFDQLFSEVELGGRRIAIPGTVMRGWTDENGVKRRGFDPGDRVFMRLEGDDAEKFKPTDLTSDIRADKFRLVIQTHLDLLSVQCGFSAGYFSFDGTSVKTATEVISDNSKTFKTMAAFRVALDEGLKHVFRVINFLGKTYQIDGAVDTEPNIRWDDSVIESRDARAAYWQGLVQNKMADRVTALMSVHGLDEAKAVEMAAKISKENAIVADPFGGPQGGA